MGGESIGRFTVMAPATDEKSFLKRVADHFFEVPRRHGGVFPLEPVD